MSRSRAHEIVRASGGAELAERLAFLDAHRAAPAPQEAVRAPEVGEPIDQDVVFAGGGLSLLLAARLARYGARVTVVERARAGATHREWNASRAELRALVDAQLVTQAELERLVVARYSSGFCAFHGGGRYDVGDVLDHAIDAGGLLARVRAHAESSGVRFLDGARVVGERAGDAHVALLVREGEGAPRRLTARALVDARGASSPYARADLVCPTVGGVIAGLDVGAGPGRIDPRVGEILVTTEDAERGRQHVWEAFPGHPGEVTVYLFYYAEAARAGSLSDLYARFFERLPSYKTGAARLVRPTFGYIPGWSRLGPAPRSPHPRIALVGDAAARHSPLTYCGFGSMLRTLEPTAEAVAALALEPGRPARGVVVDDQPLHALTGALASVMASERLLGASQNALLDAAFSTLHGMGPAAYAALLKDRMHPRDVVTFLRATAARRPRVYREVLGALGPWRAARWAAMVAGRLATTARSDPRPPVEALPAR